MFKHLQTGWKQYPAFRTIRIFQLDQAGDAHSKAAQTGKV
jgi:hypothetical protein